MATVSTNAIIDAADRLFTAIERGDLGFLNSVFDDDVAVWRSGADHDDDKERALRVLTWFIDRTTGRRYEVLDRQIFDNGFVQQHLLHATGAGEPLSLRVCIVVKYSANLLIRRVDEYFDPAGLAPLLD